MTAEELAQEHFVGIAFSVRNVAKYKHVEIRMPHVTLDLGLLDKKARREVCKMLRRVVADLEGRNDR